MFDLLCGKNSRSTSSFEESILVHLPQSKAEVVPEQENPSTTTTYKFRPREFSVKCKKSRHNDHPNHPAVVLPASVRKKQAAPLDR
jgi:hypothetical protein